VLLAILAGCPQSAAANAWKLVAGNAVVNDGVRFAAVQPDRGDLASTAILDTATGRTFMVPTPAPCGVAGRLVAVGGGQVLWASHRCDKPTWPKAEMYDLASGAFQEPSGEQAFFGDADPNPRTNLYAGNFSYVGVGSHWLALFYDAGGHDNGSDFYDWRTGSALSQSYDLHTVVDLNSPSGTKRLCAPLKIRTYEDIGTESKDYRYDPPYGLTQGNNNSTALFLDRCGQRDAILLDACHPPGRPGGSCLTPTLSAGYATWIDRNRIYVYLPRRRWLYRLRPPRMPHGVSIAGVTHTASTIFAYASRPGGGVIATYARPVR
jgi:hypothetical protein